MSDANQHITDDIFSFRKTAHWCTCIVCATQVPTTAVLSTSFVLNHVPLNNPELSTLITRLRESYSNVEYKS